MFRLLFLISLLLSASLTGTAFGQGVLGAAELLAAHCQLDEARTNYASNFQEPYVAMSTLGAVRERGGLPMDEGQTLNVYIYGKSTTIRKLNVRRTSATRNADELDLASSGNGFEVLDRGASDLLDSIRDEDTCGIIAIPVSDFDAPEGKIVMEMTDVTDGNETKQVGAEYTFSVRTLFRGGISFGPLASLLPNRAYVAATSQDGASRLTRSEGGEYEVQYALLLTYYLFGPRTRGTSLNPGVFLALPVSGIFGDNAYAGVSFDLGTVFVGSVGVRFGKVDRLVEAQEAFLVPDAQGTLPVLPDGFVVATESVWKPAFAFGVSIDAGAAAQAFGKIIGNLGGQ
ncbi:MAG: hypothetical protein AAFN13_03665 [Bacteroidota bacterium]